VRLKVDQDDDAGFGRARDWLLERFEAWVADLGLDKAAAADAASDVSIALDWKFGYDDGDLGRWTGADVREFLLRWCPRKLSVSQADCVSIPDSIAAFTDYLAANGLLAPHSARPAALRAAATGAVGEFVAAMGDPANFGMAKSIFCAAAAEGADLTDPAQLDAWMAGFNSRTHDEREAILPDSAFGTGPFGMDGPLPHMQLPAMPLPPPESVEASKAAAPVLAMLAALAGFVGAGRPLTQRGNLTLADARVLVPLLRTGDVFDDVIGDRMFKTRSAAELPVLRMLFLWAKKAGMVRVRHGKVLATKRGLALSADPAAEFDRVLDALLVSGPLTIQRVHGAWFRWPQVDELLDSMVLELLAVPYAAQGPVPISELADLATSAVLAAFEFSNLSDEQVAQAVASDVARIAEVFALAGVLTSADDAEQQSGQRLVQLGGDVELTPAGVASVERRLTDRGYLAAPDKFADATAVELLTGVGGLDPDGSAAEVGAWLRSRTPEQAVTEFAEAVPKLADPALVNVALAVMAGIGPEIAAPHVRELANDARVRGYAVCWLADNGLLDRQALYEPGDLNSFAQVLMKYLVDAGPDGLLETLALAGDEERQAAVVSELGHSQAQEAEVLLDVIGAEHQAKPVAKAARKALFLRRSRAAAPGR
jgi:hypothetical protein